MHRITFLAMLVIILSCNNNPGNDDSLTGDTSSHPVITDTLQPTLTGCYIRVLQRDTLIASFDQSGKTITGKLLFDNYEKDGSSGTVSGVVEGDIVKLIYRFQSEGMSSISEQFFKITKDGLLQGIGEVAVNGDSAYFSDPVNITYSEKDKLTKTSCDKLKI
jgi:hypothetical protein